MSLKLKVRLSMTNKDGESFMGIGLVWLLKNIREYNSIKIAAQSMNMSYMKAMKILNRLEQNLGQKMIHRYKGGNLRGGSELTEYGERFLRLYDDFQKRANRRCLSEFEKFIESLEQ